MTVELTKTDVARSQLVTAIRLFFDDRDMVSVYTLAANAWEIIDVLCKKQEVESLSKQTQENLSKHQSLKHDFINKPYRNFFKHADSDPEGTVEGFSDDKNDHLLILAVDDLMRLHQKSPFECQVFQLWYLAVYDEKIAGEELERIMPTIRSAFPDIDKLSRTEQKQMGREVMHECSQDEQLLADPRTDITELERWE